MKDFKTKNGFFTGNVGIGTTSPGKLLHVAGNAHQIVIEDADALAGNKMRGIYNNNQKLYIGRYTDDFNSFYDDMVIDSAGNIGIGATSPTSRLQIEEPVSTAQTTGLFVRNKSSHTANGGATIAGFHNADDYVMVVKTSGNVGIGTTNPTSALTISGSSGMGGIKYSSGTGSDVLALDIGYTGGGSGLVVKNTNGNVGIGTTSPIHSLDVYGFGKTIGITSTHSDQTRITHASLSTDTNGYGRLDIFSHVGNPICRLDSNGVSYINGGNVGIGTTSPDSPLHVKVGTDNNFEIHEASVTGNLRLIALNDARDVNVPIEFAASKFNFLTGNVGIGTTNPICRLHVQGSEQPILGYRETTVADHDLFILKSDVGGVDSVKFIVEADGRVGIGTTSPTSGRLDVSQAETSPDACIKTFRPGTADRPHLAFYNGSGTQISIVGDIKTNGSTTSYNTTSDYRLKENVVELTDALDRVCKLKPSRFNFIAHKDKTVDGFLAHEVSSIVPEAVSGEKDVVDDEGNPEYQSIDLSKLIPLLTKAIQEQQTIIEDLKARIETLES